MEFPFLHFCTMMTDGLLVGWFVTRSVGEFVVVGSDGGAGSFVGDLVGDLVGGGVAGTPHISTFSVFLMSP